MVPNKNRLKLGKKRGFQSKITTAGMDGVIGVSNHDTSLGLDLGSDFDGGGYIIESGNIIQIEKVALDSVNKFALNVIQHTVRDHFDPNRDENENFAALQKNMMNTLEKSAGKSARKNEALPRPDSNQPSERVTDSILKIGSKLLNKLSDAALDAATVSSLTKRKT